MQKYASPYSYDHGFDPLARAEAGGQPILSDFSEAAVRRGFIRKVFGIVGVQLAFTALTCAFFMTHPFLNGYLSKNQWPLYVAMVLSLGLSLTLSCNVNLTRTFPANYGLLAAFTACISFLVGTACMLSSPTTVLLAAGLTAGITTGLALFAFQTKYDFTAFNGILAGCLWGLLGVSLVGIFFPAVSWLHLLIGYGGAMLFCCYIVVDIQMMMDGHRHSISPDDYVLAAVHLYLDIINLFLHILSILNESR